MSSVPSIKLLDGTSIPWLGWGNGTGEASQSSANAVECGKAALECGIRYLDTAQTYENEGETGEAIKASSVKREDIYVTSKLSGKKNDDPVPHDEVVKFIEGSLKRLGFVPNLYLVHNPYVAEHGRLKEMWKIFEDLKDQGKLQSIGVSNFRVQDLETILDGAKYKPVINQLEYHPYVLAHLQPVLDLQAKHSIVTASYGPLTPTLRHPTGGPLKPILQRIAQRISKETGKKLDENAVLLLWTRAQGVVAVTTSSNLERIKDLGVIATLPDLLTREEIDEITRVGKTIHFRHYTEHMEKDFPLPNLPSQ